MVLAIEEPVEHVLFWSKHFLKSFKMSDMYSTIAWAKTSPDSEFSQIEISRNLAGENDVTFDLKYCGICHTDVHVACNHMGNTHYPCVPGHELAGIVTKVGANVTKVKVGDRYNQGNIVRRRSIRFWCSDILFRVGVGCISDSCMNCEGCAEGEEHLCAGRMTSTYDREITHGHIKTNTGWTFGGYSGSQTVHERWKWMLSLLLCMRSYKIKDFLLGS